MRRVFAALIGAAVVPLCAGLASAQPPPEPKDGKVTIRLELTPAAIPPPAPECNLLPGLRDAIPGNRVQGFLKTFMQYQGLFRPDEHKRREGWLIAPLDQLPVAELRDYPSGSYFRGVEDASRMTDADWQVLYALRRDGYGALLPDVQQMRDILAVLKVRARGQVAAGDFPAAVRTLRAIFALAKTLEAHPTVIGFLTGAAVAGHGCDVLEELVSRPGCPNLFWSLADLPAPFVDLRLALDGERVMTDSYFEPLREAVGPLSDVRLDELLRRVDEIGSPEGPTGGERPGPRLRKSAADADRVNVARDRLVRSHGRDPAAVAAMSALQAVVADDLRRAEVLRDELFRWVPLPYPQAAPGLAAAQAAVEAARGDVVLVDFVIPGSVRGVIGVRARLARLDQRFAALRVVEAVRLYAHDHAGQLPPTLADVPLPLPLDPVSGKPFGYAVKDGVATLHGQNATPADPKFNRYYELRIRR